MIILNEDLGEEDEVGGGRGGGRGSGGNTGGGGNDNGLSPDTPAGEPCHERRESTGSARGLTGGNCSGFPRRGRVIGRMVAARARLSLFVGTVLLSAPLFGFPFICSM